MTGAMTELPPAFLARPIAHRALHGAGRPENSRAAIRAAAEAGYGIEIDLQPSADGVAMVFHDAALSRMTGAAGPVRARPAAELGRLTLTGSDEGIPTFAEVLDLVAGRVPLLVELKDQTGAMGPGDGALEEAAARAAQGYAGPLAFMSFNPHAVADIARAAPDVPRGRVTCAFLPENWPGLAPDRCAALARIDGLEETGCAFISHAHAELDLPRVAEVKAAGLPVATWTIRSEREARAALGIADQITFEGYLPS